MIANLMTTLIMALGVATGNVSSNSYKGGNAFNNEEKIEAIQIEQNPKKAATEINVIEHYDWITDLTVNNTVYTKYYMQEGNYTPNYTNNYFYIRNTTYTYNTGYANENWQILSIVNNYNEVVNTNIKNAYSIQIEPPNFTTALTIKQKFYMTDDNEILDYIDKTLTPSIGNDLNNLITKLDNQTIENEVLINNTESRNVLVNQDTYYIENETGLMTIPSMTTLNLVIYNKVSSNILSLTNLRPDTIYFTGTVFVPDINYEIVDVPDLMFTILTLPFTFYSTAFNLTIFPNTPYALNFGNIILTIVAALILMYLIKKVIK